MNNSSIQLENIAKVIGGETLLSDINLTVPLQEIVGITGPNGSGKSMLLRVITGLVKPTHGAVTVFGQYLGENIEFAPETGILIDIPQFLPRYSGFKNLELLASIRQTIDRHEITDSLRRVGLDPEDKRYFHTYSTGMRQRLGIAQSIMENPRLLILDEPTRGIDEAGSKEIRELIKKLRDEGKTILIASHFAEEIDGLCDQVYVMNRGRLHRYQA